MSIELLGWIGGIFLSICAFPQVYKTYNEHSATGLSLWMLILWWVGEVCTLGYVLYTNIQVGDFQLPLIINYIVNIVMVVYLIYAKVKY
jgi:uncharacterized protein with PQ loop repeat